MSIGCAADKTFSRLSPPAGLRYARAHLSPAATWKGAIGKGTIVINVSHPSPEEVSIKKPKDRFRKVSETRYEWTFTKLEPTLADDLTIIAHRAYDSYFAGHAGADEGEQAVRDYVIEGDHYFLLHADYQAVASSTLAPTDQHKYDAGNIKASSLI